MESVSEVIFAHLNQSPFAGQPLGPNGCDSYHDLQFNGGAGVEDESDTICPIPGSMQKTKKLHLAGRGLGGGKKAAQTLAN